MDSHRRRIASLVAALAVVLSLGASASAQLGSQVKMPKYDEPADIANLPMLGRWKINIAKSTNNGSRANSDTFTWVFKVEGDKIRHDIYDVYPADKPSRSYAVKLNGSEASDPHEVGIGETISGGSHPSRMYREVKQKGVGPAHIYAVSAEARCSRPSHGRRPSPTLRGISNLMYFDRQAGPEGRSEQMYDLVPETLGLRVRVSNRDRFSLRNPPSPRPGPSAAVR